MTRYTPPIMQVNTQNTDSPCIRNCCLNNNDVCVGCKRTLEEIVHWRDYSIEQRQKILQRINNQL